MYTIYKIYFKKQKEKDKIYFIFYLPLFFKFSTIKRNGTSKTTAWQHGRRAIMSLYIYTSSTFYESTYKNVRKLRPEVLTIILRFFPLLLHLSCFPRYRRNFYGHFRILRIKIRKNMWDLFVSLTVPKPPILHILLSTCLLWSDCQ